MGAKARAKKSPEVDAYLARSTKWPRECARLRTILLGCGLTEALKWGKPCYSHDGNNIAIIQEFKAFAALMFFKGALLQDAHGLLESQGEHTRSALRVCFTSVAQVADRKAAVQDLVRQAIAVGDAKVTVAAPEPELVEELAARLERDRALKAAFEALTPGRQRGYSLYVAGAKKSDTRAARVERCVPRIRAGKGLHD